MKIIHKLAMLFPLLLGEKVGLRGLPRAASSVATILLICSALTGCVNDILESKVAEPQVYVLRTGDVATANVAYPIQLGVAWPTATPGLDTNRIAVLRNNNQLDYYFGARWGSTAPHMVQNFLIDTLQAQQGFKSVAAENARIDADYLLELHLKDFQAEYAGAASGPVVRITVSGNLISIKTRKLVGAVNATATASSDNSLSAVVAAFETALREVSREISAQLSATAGK